MIAVTDIAKWDDLPKFIQQSVTSKNASHRESGLILCSHLFENLGEEIMKKMDYFMQIFQNGLKDENENVRAASLR